MLRTAALTRANVAEAAVACFQAHQVVFGATIGRGLLCTLAAQSALETGRWTAMYEWNAGNVRGEGTAGRASIEGASEVIDGTEWFFRRGVWQTKAGVAAPADVAARLGDNGFAAFRNLTEGFERLIRMLGTASHPPKPNRYAAAWDAAERGDVPAYCAGLKAGGYYTADVGLYTRGVAAQFTWVQAQLFKEPERLP